MLNLGAIGFAAPWMLLGLILLPVIWWLLRIIPPTPRRVSFPAVRLLLSLRPTDETSATTPLWLTILRMVLAALVILALAHPLLNPSADLDGDGPLLLVVDDGWAAAPNWDARQDMLDGLLDRAQREDRSAALLSTAPPADGAPIAVSKLTSAADLRPTVRALTPRPWPVDRAAATAALADITFERTPQIVWLSDGIDDGAAEGLSQRLAQLGPLTVIAEDSLALAKALSPPEISGSGLRASVLRADPENEEQVWVRAMAEGGRVLARSRATFEAGQTRAETDLELPSELRNQAVRLDVDGEASAAAVVLLAERWRRRPVGMVSGAATEEQTQPLLSNLYYLDRALSPYSDVRLGDVTELLRRPTAVLVLADIGRLDPGAADVAEQWVRDGGMLVRFAGPRMAQNADDLIPVRLRGGGRALDGSLSWAQPARLADFPETSPFHGLEIADDIFVRRQVLAEPSLDLNRKTWARLADGTPLVTADRLDDGWLVLFHSTANTDWTNLPITGLFVDMLRRLVTLSRGVAGEDSEAMLPPLASLSGDGQLGPASAAARPIAGDVIDATDAGPRHPPGFYGDDDAKRALNLSSGIDGLLQIGDYPGSAAVAPYAEQAETDLKPWLLTAAILLALVDIVAALALRGLLSPQRRARAAASLLLLGVVVALPMNNARAQDPSDEFVLQATLDTRLAYVLTGDDEIDAMSRAGLIGLSEILRRRTSIEPADPFGLDIESDELVFFPLIYWPLTPTQPPLSDAALARIDNYMRTGGTILFDTRDSQTANLRLPGGVGGGSANNQRLRQMLRRLDVPPLVPVPQHHVLTRAFYLMQSFPGRYANGRVWVELRPGGVNDGVASIIIGGNDWAAAWATDDLGRPMAAVVPGGPRQREMAFRFGVNLVMYTLTGNYKTDQVHVPAILERLGQ